MAGPVRPIEHPIRLAVIDDHPLIATAIEAALATGGSVRSVTLVGVASTEAEGRALLERTGDDAPDVVLCDLQLDRDAGGTPGLALIDSAGRDGPKMIVLTAFDRSSFMRAAFERGAAGFLSKTAPIEDILGAVRTVAAGGTAFSGEALEAARSGRRPPSEREVAILRAAQAGMTSAEIGARLGISARTVESHLRRLFDRYGVVSRTELVALAMREGWLSDGG